MQRNLGLDALRGLAVVLMIQQHLGVWLTMLRGNSRLLSFSIGLNVLGGAAAPLFLVLAGWGAALATAPSPTERAREPNWPLRAALLGAVAYALNLATPVWFSWGSFYVLHTIAVFWLLLPWLARWETRALLGTGLLLIVGAWLAQLFLHTPADLDNARMSKTALPGGVLRLAFFEGHFPLFPWLALPLFGLSASRWHSAQRWRDLAALVGTLAALGAGLRAVGELRPSPALAPGLEPLTRFSFYPASAAFILLLTSLALALAWGASELGQRGALEPTSTWVALGRISLTLLVAHVWLFRQVASWLGWQNQLRVPLSLAVLILTLGVAAGLAQLWSRAGYRYSLEWLLRAAERRWGPPAAPRTPKKPVD